MYFNNLRTEKVLTRCVIFSYITCYIINVIISAPVHHRGLLSSVYILLNTSNLLYQRIQRPGLVRSFKVIEFVCNIYQHTIKSLLLYSTINHLCKVHKQQLYKLQTD